MNDEDLIIPSMLLKLQKVSIPRLNPHIPKYIFYMSTEFAQVEIPTNSSVDIDTSLQQTSRA